MFRGALNVAELAAAILGPIGLYVLAYRAGVMVRRAQDERVRKLSAMRMETTTPSVGQPSGPISPIRTTWFDRAMDWIVALAHRCVPRWETPYADTLDRLAGASEAAGRSLTAAQTELSRVEAELNRTLANVRAVPRTYRLRQSHPTDTCVSTLLSTGVINRDEARQLMGEPPLLATAASGLAHLSRVELDETIQGLHEFINNRSNDPLPAWFHATANPPPPNPAPTPAAPIEPIVPLDLDAKRNIKLK